MKTVKVKRDELLAVVRKNRETHRATFLKAVDGLEKKWRSSLEEKLAAIRSGRRPDRYVLVLTEPQDQTKDYDRAIKSLEMETRDEIELDQHEFAQLVMDDWQWKGQFTATTSQYL